MIAVNPHSREVILDGRRVPHSSIFDLIKSLYEGKQKAKYLNLHGEKEFLSKIAKVFDKAGIEKTGKFISKREKVNLISSKRAQMEKVVHDGQGSLILNYTPLLRLPKRTRLLPAKQLRFSISIRTSPFINIDCFSDFLS